MFCLLKSMKIYSKKTFSILLVLIPASMAVRIQTSFFFFGFFLFFSVCFFLEFFLTKNEGQRSGMPSLTWSV